MNKLQIHLFHFVLLIATIFSCMNSYSQEKSINSKLNFRLGGGIVNSGKGQTVSDMMLNPILQLEADYELNKIVNVGIYAAYAPLMHRTELPYNSATGQYEWYSADSTSYLKGVKVFYESSQSIYYGISSNIHILPLFLSGNLRLDVYVTPKIGIASEQYTAYNDIAETVWSQPFIEYGFGLGVKYYTGKRFGFYGEYSLGRYYNNNPSRFLGGIVLKF